MKKIVFILFLTLILTLSSQYDAHASVVDELRNRISDRNTKIQELEKEIEQYQDDLEEVGKEKQTLTSEVKTLDISRQKIGADIRLTQNKIDSTSLQIEELSLNKRQRSQESLQYNK